MDVVGWRGYDKLLALLTVRLDLQLVDDLDHALLFLGDLFCRQTNTVRGYGAHQRDSAVLINYVDGRVTRAWLFLQGRAYMLHQL
jgi:hypothetical protein